jgi:hypothetical protein
MLRSVSGLFARHSCNQLFYHVRSSSVDLRVVHFFVSADGVCVVAACSSAISLRLLIIAAYSSFKRQAPLPWCHRDCYLFHRLSSGMHSSHAHPSRLRWPSRPSLTHGFARRVQLVLRLVVDLVRCSPAGGLPSLSVGVAVVLVRTARLYSVRCRFCVGSCCTFMLHFVSGVMPPMSCLPSTPAIQWLSHSDRTLSLVFSTPVVSGFLLPISSLKCSLILSTNYLPRMVGGPQAISLARLCSAGSASTTD